MPFAGDDAPAETIERVTVDTDEEGARLDVFIARKLGVSRSFARKMIEDGRVASDGDAQLKIKPSTRVTHGGFFAVRVPPPETLEIEPEDVSFEIVHEDRWLLVVNKPAGLVVHPAPGHWRRTLVHGLLWRYPDMGPFNNVLRPGIVHRLDATTSGLMLVAREQRAMELLQRNFKERTVEKCYLALTQGNFERIEGVLEGPIDRHPNNRLKMAVVEGGRPSATEYRVLWNRRETAVDSPVALVLCRLITGRTHQIRVHMAAAGHPLVGDALYGAKKIPGFERVFLHSWRLSFAHPITGERLTFTRPLPEELVALLPQPV